MRCGLAIFVKTPTLSSVKTRLWPAIGREQATTFFELSADATRSVVEEAMSSLSLQGYWAVAESAAVEQVLWTGLPLIAQGAGGLGERMAQVYARLRRDHHAVILVGADSPQLMASALEDAASWLDVSESRLAIGPAEDGGFWLFGGNVDLPVAAWLQPEYSNAGTANAFKASMNGHGTWLTLGSLRDVDRAEDIGPVILALAELPNPTPQQASLQGFLNRMHIDTEAST